jgi:hypothetical protein
MRNDWLPTVTVSERPSTFMFAPTLSVGEALPSPELGVTSAHVASVWAVHPQPEPTAIAKAKLPPRPGTRVGSPVTLGVQLDPLGEGPPDVAGGVAGDATGEGPVELSLFPLHAAARIASVTGTSLARSGRVISQLHAYRWPI